MKVLFIHANYTQWGGEDTTAKAEFELFDNAEIFKTKNKLGFWGLVQFIISIANFGVSRKICKLIEDVKPDIIHIHNLHFSIGPWVIRDIKRKYNLPVVMTINNFRLLCPSGTFLINGKVDTVSLTESFPYTAIRKGGYRNSVVLTFWLSIITWFHGIISTWSKVDRYLVQTRFAQQLFATKNKVGISQDKFLIKENAVNDEGCGPLTRNGRLLFVSRLSEEKGINFLVDLADSLDLPLDIVGDGPLRSDLEAKVNPHSKIIFHGTLGRDEMKEMMRHAHALLFPSLWYEGMPITILEAFSCGLPVVASDLGAMSSMITNGLSGYLVEPNHWDDWKAAIQMVQGLNDEEHISLQTGARKAYLDHYTPERSKAGLERIYKSLVNEPLLKEQF